MLVGKALQRNGPFILDLQYVVKVATMPYRLTAGHLILVQGMVVRIYLGQQSTFQLFGKIPDLIKKLTQIEFKALKTIGWQLSMVCVEKICEVYQKLNFFAIFFSWKSSSRRLTLYYLDWLLVYLDVCIVSAQLN